MPKIDVTLAEVLTPEQLIHVKAKARGIVKASLTRTGKLMFTLGGQYYVLGYNKAGGHIDVYATVKTRAWHPLIIMGCLVQFIWNILMDIVVNSLTLCELFTPKQFSYNAKITSFVNIKKK